MGISLILLLLVFVLLLYFASRSFIVHLFPADRYSDCFSILPNLTHTVCTLGGSAPLLFA